MSEEDDTEKGEADTDDGERIVIVVDPFTRKASVYNYTTCKFIEIDGKVILDKNGDDEVMIRINALLTLKGLKCRFPKPEK